MVFTLIWMLLLTISVCGVVLTTATGDNTAQMAATGLVSLMLGIFGIAANRRARNSGASEYAIAAATARSMGLVWAWCALCLLLIYLIYLSWGEWWQFFLLCAAAATVCLFVAATLDRDDAKGAKDDTMLKIANGLAAFQLAGMIVTVVGLYLDGKLDRFKHARPGWEDWAGNNVFFFGAIALAAISAYALFEQRKHAKSSET